MRAPLAIYLEVIENYNKSGTILRHTQVIREYLNIKPDGSDARHLIVISIGAAARTKDEPSDLINVAIEELIRQQYELQQDNTYTSWNFLKQDPGTPTITHLKDLVNYLTWLSLQNVGIEVLSNIPDIKIKQFAAEANTLNAAQMKALEPNK
ncbi:DUF4158 domain-containing protein [Clostridium estertheticum]|uniref:DUF4158 domain-containing protein n=1 Tax=Clostridium estertheticum TaxID=238834 RepID=UPI001C7DE1AF|nr:DUF4158 domain-containing protein [Clostridium estertheticum]MBX4270031.1 DUF4158 domain-containing protein [Clostridium estertheticum]WLC80238.1 DUF4158 domain-containing protein [Clostridium estertheticum]